MTGNPSKNQTKTKHVESSATARLDEGSNPSGSTIKHLPGGPWPLGFFVLGRWGGLLPKGANKNPEGFTETSGRYLQHGNHYGSPKVISSKNSVGIRRPTRQLAPSLKMSTGHFLNARSSPALQSSTFPVAQGHWDFFILGHGGRYLQNGTTGYHSKYFTNQVS